MRALLIDDSGCVELDTWPEQLPARGHLWLTGPRRQFEVQVAQVQAALQRWTGGSLVDLHISDLLNPQLPSHYDYTSWYDLMVFRRLAAAPAGNGTPEPGSAGTPMQALKSVDTSPVGFAVFDRVLLSVHPDECPVREYFTQRLIQTQPASAGVSRLPTSPADLMLRIVNHMVDSYLELRRLLTRQLEALQNKLLGPRSRHMNWHALLQSRNRLHHLEDICEDQRSAIQEWIDSLDEWPVTQDSTAAREHELLRVRSRDVREHIERVLSHVRRLESSSESAVQMHFSALGQRTNDIMRTLTVLTAIFLPLNLITGIFGMNFDFLPLIHSNTGFWIALVLMVGVALALGLFFWRKRYLDSSH